MAMCTCKSRLYRPLQQQVCKSNKQTEQATATSLRCDKQKLEWFLSLLHLQLVDLLQDGATVTALLCLHGAHPLLQILHGCTLVFKILRAGYHLLSVPAVYNTLSSIGRAATN